MEPQFLTVIDHLALARLRRELVLDAVFLVPFVNLTRWEWGQEKVMEVLNGIDAAQSREAFLEQEETWRRTLEVVAQLTPCWGRC